MSRETKRRTDNEDEMFDDALAFEPATPRSRRAAAPARRRRTSPAQFLREVRDEMRQVAWPSRAEMVNYTAVVITTLVIMITLIFFLNFIFGKTVLFLFTK
ncbi:MAG TPA: preprotein translocase subunit SecE [Acidimicrobiales bacterium]|nr:preprotein translocase subunit SecE [Acidimicrobiales bacterium]